MTEEQLYKTMLEVADVSNTLDFLFERLLREYSNQNGDND